MPIRAGRPNGTNVRMVSLRGPAVSRLRLLQILFCFDAL